MKNKENINSINKQSNISQYISKSELSQNNLNIINKIYVNCPDNNQENIHHPNIMNNRIKPSIIENNSNDQNNNQSQDVKLQLSQNQNNNDDINIQNMLRNKFIRKVYGILISQLILTFSLILICQINIIKQFLLSHRELYLSLMIFSLFIFIISFIIFMCKPSLMKKVPQNYIFLFLFTISETILLIYISILYSFYYVLGAIVFVIGICIAIFTMSCFNKKSFKFLFSFFIVCCFLGILYGILAIIFRNYYLEFLFCLIGAIIFTIFLIYDTQKISQDENYLTIDDYIFAAILLYTDIIRLFIYLLRILGRLSGKAKNYN
jgi:FtsH-binding integral membrane protein